MMLAYLILDFPHKGKNALIEDLFARDDDEYLTLILVSEAIAILKKDNIDSLWISLVEKTGNLLHFFSFRYGFISRPSGSKSFPKAQFLYYPLKQNLDNTYFSDNKQWNIHSADTSFLEKY
jgi:hypothetical protein